MRILRFCTHTLKSKSRIRIGQSDTTTPICLLWICYPVLLELELEMLGNDDDDAETTKRKKRKKTTIQPAQVTTNHQPQPLERNGTERGEGSAPLERTNETTTTHKGTQKQTMGKGGGKGGDVDCCEIMCLGTKKYITHHHHRHTCFYSSISIGLNDDSTKCN